ncbi:MAG: thiopurine S-methyltransferase [Geminicoccaceae bacterium]
MEPAFWQNRWKENKIAFHEDKANVLLSKHFSRLALTEGSRVFVPLCGKTNDLAWLVDQGYQVVGIELNQAAVEEAFHAMGISPRVEKLDQFIHYRSDIAEVFAGDFFDLSTDMLGTVDAIYDRAALVALPSEMRQPYTRHLIKLTKSAPQFLISYEYDQSQTEGPPFSVPGNEISKLYHDQYTLELIASVDVSGSLSKRCHGNENAWLLSTV